MLSLTWLDIDFANQTVPLASKASSDRVLQWERKGHASRTVLIPAEMVQFLADLQAEADVTSPYVFANGKRLLAFLCFDPKAAGSRSKT